MVSKDQGIGGAILAVCVIVAVGYFVLVADPGLFSLNTTTAQAGCSIGSRFHSIHRYTSDRCMDRLDNGNDTPAKTNRRNHN